jgi:long-chain acyl-CoA synthetase
MASMAACTLDTTSSEQQDTHIWESSYPKGIDWRQSIDVQPLTHILEHAVSRFPNRPALNDGVSTLTYKELDGLTNQIAAGLQKLGVKKGIKVGVFLPNTIHSISFHYGILKAGGTVVNYNPMYAERELIHQVTDSETTILVTICNPALLDKAEAILGQTCLEKIVVCPDVGQTELSEITLNDNHVPYDSVVDNDGSYDAVTIDAREDIAVLQYTGGTTGVPKGAMLTHANLYANAMQTALWYKELVVPGEEKLVGVLPLFHVFAMTVVMNVSLWYGMEILLVSKFDPRNLLDLLKDKQPSFFPAVPAVYNAIVNHPKAADLDLSCVKFCKSGGAPLPGEVMKAMNEKFGATIGEGYGLTETSPVACSNPVNGNVKLGSIGQPVPGTLIEIVSMEDGVTPLAQGETGEICISGPQVMKGYYKKQDETDLVLKGSRFHTGDIGYMDEDGYVFLVDRLKDMILVSGYNVYPRQVEEAIYMHPAVEECLVTGVPDQKRGEAVQAWVKLIDEKTLEESDLRRFLQDKLSPIEMPRKFVFRDTELPKTAVGKLSRKLLREEEGIA